ncbi:hypothetical protein F443_18594 [Phytophthora nicotianae P1569]|uniref:Ubiquitin-like protease family profile domain-containing protein n=1 Tax=Phytophthora nicotianae P1569 TaxID=1317065 RepID=V9E7E9_PHYNI|nr:hypothetical protein F443_18594 [Phytophthora nicotianae P1569]
MPQDAVGADATAAKRRIGATTAPDTLVGGGDNASEAGESEPGQTCSNDDEMGGNDGHGINEEAGREEEAGRVSETDGDGEDDGERTSVPQIVEPPVKYHASWEDWQSYFEDYCQRTLQVIPVKETMSRAERNKRLKKTKKGEDESQLVPEGFDPYQRTYICTHGWKIGSPAVKEVGRGSTFASPIAHSGMLAVGAKRSRIYDYLLEHDENVIQSHMDNLARVHASSVSNADDNDATAREIAVFQAADPENVSTVSETPCGETRVLSLVSKHMRRVYSRFSELLLVDCSHKTNRFRYNYQLLTFMTMHKFGEGTVVQQSLIEANGDWHMERAVEHFKRSHPTRIHLLRVIVVDKDLNEIRVLESKFPEARILICHFHVIKYLKEMRANPEFGKLFWKVEGWCGWINEHGDVSYDEEMTTVLHFKTHYVAQQIEQQYATALAKAETYNYVDDSDGGDFVVVNGVFSEHKLRTQFERYREAVRATHLIANEMADIEDETEFDEMLQVVLDQWRNVRQRKRTSKIKGEEDGSADSDEQGGDCDVVNDDQVKAEFGLISSEEDGDDDVKGTREDGAESKDEKDHEGIAVNIRLNPKAKKVGRPQKKKKASSAGEKKDRKWFEAAESGRKIAGEVTLTALLDSLDHEKPGLEETQRRLSGVLVKHGDTEKKKPKYKIMKNPILILDPFFILPNKLLDACVKLLPVRNTVASAISIEDSQSSQTSSPQRATGKEGVETLIIKDVGSFSRRQIETFKRVQNLKDVVQIGMDTHKRLVETGIPTLPATIHDEANLVADEVMATYPYKPIQGLPNLSDYPYAMLHRATPPTWLNDACIRALCWRLSQDYPNCRFAGFQSAVPKSKRTRNTDDQPVEASVRGSVLQFVNEPDVDTVMVTLNFSNFHWCCVVIKVKEKRIYFYDPLNQGPYMNAAVDGATNLKISGLQDYDVIPQNNPLQFDGYSCGVYVCWMFIHKVVPGSPVDTSDKSLTRRRFNLFFYLLTSRLLPFEGPLQQTQLTQATRRKTRRPRAATRRFHRRRSRIKSISEAAAYALAGLI